MNWNIIFYTVVKILCGSALLIIPYWISKWFIIQRYPIKPVLYKVTSKWDYAKGVVVAVLVGALIFFGSNNTHESDTHDYVELTHENAMVAFIVMALGGIAGVFASHFIIRERNEKEYYNEKTRDSHRQ